MLDTQHKLMSNNIIWIQHLLNKMHHMAISNALFSDSKKWCPGLQQPRKLINDVKNSELKNINNYCTNFIIHHKFKNLKAGYSQMHV